MQGTFGLRHHEVVHELAVAAERLRALAGEAALEVARAQLRDVVRGRSGERALAQPVADLGDPRSPPLQPHPDRPRPDQVADASRCQQGRRPERHVAVDVPGQVHAEEGQRGVGHRIDQRLDEVALLRPQVEVGTAEGDDSRIGRGAGGDGQAIGAHPGAAHREAGAHLGWPRAGRVVAKQGQPAGPGLHPVNAAVRDHRRARAGQVRSKRPGHVGEVDDPRRGRVQGGDPPAMRLHVGELGGRQPPQPGYLVLPSAPLQLVQGRQFARIARHDHLPAAVVADPVLVAELVHLARALHAQARLERPGHVVDARVDDPAVGARLTARHRGSSLEHDRAQPGPAPRQLARHRQSDDAAAHDGQVALLRRDRHLSPLASGARLWPAAPGRSRPSA